MRVLSSRVVERGRLPTAIVEVEHRPPLAKAVGSVGLAAGAGAVAEYLLDPDRGRSRRAKVYDKLGHVALELNSGLDVLARDLGNRSRGIVAGTRYRVFGHAADDQVLHERVRAELGRHVGHPHAIDVHVEDGMVMLSGDVLADEEEQTRRALKRVAGVKQVEARWTTHHDATGVSQLQGAARSRGPVPELLQQHWSPAARFMAGSSAVVMCAASARLPRPLTWAVRGIGSALAVRALTNISFKRLTGITAGRRAVDVQDGIAVAARPEEVWSLVSDYTVFPYLTPDVRDVRRSADGQQSHWEIAGPAGVPVRFDATETTREEGREIAWRTKDGQLVAHTGRIRLDPEDDGRTRIQVQLTYNPMAGAVGHALATLFGADPRHKLVRDLQRLKSFIETGQQPGDSAKS